MSISSRTVKGRKQYRFDLRYKSSGQTKRKSSKWYPTKKEALQAEKDFLDQIEAEDAPVMLTFGQIWEEYIADRVSRNLNSKTTADEKNYSIQQYFSDWIAVPIDQISVQTVRSRFAKSDITGLSTNTKNKLRSFLLSAFGYAVRYHGLKENPISALEPYSYSFDEKERRKTAQIWTPEEFASFLFQMEDDDYSRIFEFIYWTGLRRSEAMSLTFSDLDGDFITIRRQWDQKREEWTATKTAGSYRKIRLPRRLLQIIEEQRQKYQDEPHFTAEWFIFGGYRYLSRTTMDRKKKKAIEAAGLPYMTTHQLRHAYISNLLAEEGNAFLVGRSAGHSNTDMTLRTYGHVSVSDFSDLIDSMMEKSEHPLH